MRYIITNSVVRPFIRQQESFHLTICPQVLASASEKFLWRCGFQATGTRSMVEGYGYYGSGKSGDSSGALVNSRRAMDAGEYKRIGELVPGESEQETPTLIELQRRHEPMRKLAHQVIDEIQLKQDSAPHKK